ncbi:hypothetical protein DLM78_22665 [Leptospira stimsonii]|uniref:Uncharacterized protein n=1 Tax=Leptospira stimsonii TaxID=2202203 RepID=A0A8B3CHP8_9LEPT|nr:hypothetical protein DLM78_22665 [Leptospira stimsonii]
MESETVFLKIRGKKVEILRRFCLKIKAYYKYTAVYSYEKRKERIRFLRLFYSNVLFPFF